MHEQEKFVKVASTAKLCGKVEVFAKEACLVVGMNKLIRSAG